MSESEDSYTVVEELEEGEIVDNAEAEAQACRKNRKRQRSLPRCYAALNTEYHAGRKWMMPKRMEGVELYGQLTGCGPRRPLFKEPNLVTHTKPVAPAHRPNAARAPQKPAEVRMPCPPQRSRVAPKNIPRAKARTLRSPAGPVPEELPRNGIEKPPCPQLDINSSYDDLLKHHRAIQKELARLEKEQKASRKRCVHKEERRKKRAGADAADKNVACPKKIRPSEGKEAASSRQPAAKSPVTKASAKNSPRIGGKLPTRGQSRVTDVKPSAEAVKSQVADPDVQGGVADDDEDLEQLRLRALATCFSKLPAASNGPLDLEKGRPNSFVDQVGVNKENSVPNSSVGSSAFSVSLNFDNYSVLDMEESDTESAMAPCVVVDEPDPLPPPPEAIPLPPRNEEDDDLEIVMLRAQVLRSMAKATGAAKEQSEPDSTTPFVVDEEEVVHSDGNSAEEGPVLVKPVESSRSISAVGRDSDEATASPPPKPSSSTAALQVPRVSNGVAGPGETMRSQTCGAKFKTQQQNAKFGDHPWVFMKQDPLIINLQEDSTEESDSEPDSERENKVSTLALLERLIEAEKNKSNPSKPADAPGGGSSTPDLAEEPAGIVGNSVGSETAGESRTQSQPVSPRPGKIAPERPDPPAVPSPRNAVVPEERKAPVRSLVNAYQLLQKKLALASSTLRKEQQILTMTKIHASKKMSSFITSQLEVQRLKEQLTAAERVKNTSMRMMFRANVQLKTVQNSVDRRATLIRDLEEECRRLETQLSTRVPSPSRLEPKT